MKHKEYVEEYSSVFRGSNDLNNLDTFQSATWKDIPHINMYDYPSFEPSEQEIEPPQPPLPPIYTSMPSSIYYPSSRPSVNRYSYSPSKTSGIYSYAPIPFSYAPIPPLNTDTTCPTTSPTYSAIPTYSPSNNSINTTTIDFSNYSNYDKYNTAIFGIAIGIGSCCFCVICVYVYKIYASKKNKLQKIQKNALKHEYESLNDIHITDYNSRF
jgi:hypothetical protein